MILYLFFFSSRRRHTRWTGDWSSDVCSSDLHLDAVRTIQGIAGGKMLGDARETQIQPRHQVLPVVLGHFGAKAPREALGVSFHLTDEIEHLFRREADQRLTMDLHEYS